MASQVSAAQAMGVQVSKTHHETQRVEPSSDSFSQIQRVKDNGDGTFLLSSIRTGNEKSTDILDKAVPFLKNLSNDLIYWSFTTSFWMFVLATIIAFGVITSIFALLIIAFVDRAPSCLSPNLSELKFTGQFNDALHLSWTTFTTVGYGLIAPATGGHFLDDDAGPENFDEEGRCLLVGFLLSFESLFGVIFAGFCSAVLFGKITSFQSNAKIIFSDIMTVSLGDEVNVVVNKDTQKIETLVVDEDESIVITENQEIVTKYECPRVTFRMLNELHATATGEIVDASISTVATIDARNGLEKMKGERVFKGAMQQSIHEETDLLYFSNKIGIATVQGVKGVTKVVGKGASAVGKGASVVTKGAKKGVHVVGKGVDSILKPIANTVRFKSSEMDSSRSSTNAGSETSLQKSEIPDRSARMSRFASVKMIGTDCPQQADEMESPNLIFASIDVEPATHPFFSTTWVVSHVLDARSPLLTKEARKAIRKEGGYWPKGLFNKEGLENAIDFDQFLISFEGQSKSTGQTVYEQHIFTKEDVKCGWEFKSVLMRNPDGSIFVRVGDVNLIKKQQKPVSQYDSSLLKTKSSVSKCTVDNLETEKKGNGLEISNGD